VSAQEFRKKPVTITAIQFDGTPASFKEIDEFCEGAVVEVDGQPFIRTLEGDMLVGRGDWVIRGVAGEFYPCKDSIFRETYDEVGGHVQRV
jgi:hypothetical protein